MSRRWTRVGRRLAEGALGLSLLGVSGCCVCDEDGGDGPGGVFARAAIGDGEPLPLGDYEFTFAFDGTSASLGCAYEPWSGCMRRFGLPSGWVGAIEVDPRGRLLEARLWREEEVRCGTRSFGPSGPVTVAAYQDGELLEARMLVDGPEVHTSASGPECGSVDVQSVEFELLEPSGDGDGDGDGDGEPPCDGDLGCPCEVDDDCRYGASCVDGMCEYVDPNEYCDLWAEQPCPPDQKCQPVAIGTAHTWTDTICVPAGTDPVGAACCLAGVGECSAEGGTGADSCDATSMCLDLDGDTLQGVCTEFCAGPQEAPSCPQSGHSCFSSHGGVVNVCRPPCDPLLPDACPTDELCSPGNDPSGDAVGFACTAPGTYEPGGYGDTCRCLNCCLPGYACAGAEAVGAGCATDYCCTAYCEVGNPDSTCDGPDQACIPLFVPSDPLYGHIGRCEVP